MPPTGVVRKKKGRRGWGKIREWAYEINLFHGFPA